MPKNNKKNWTEKELKELKNIYNLHKQGYENTAIWEKISPKIKDRSIVYQCDNCSNGKIIEWGCYNPAKVLSDNDKITKPRRYDFKVNHTKHYFSYGGKTGKIKRIYYLKRYSANPDIEREKTI